MDSRCEARKTPPAGRKLLKTTEKDTLLLVLNFFFILPSLFFL